MRTPMALLPEGLVHQLLTLGLNVHSLRINSIETTDIQIRNGFQFLVERVYVFRADLY